MKEDNKPFDRSDIPLEDEPEDLPARDEIEGAPVYFEEPPADCTVIGVRFRTSAKVYYFDPDGKEYPEGCHAIVETARGEEYGAVVQSNHIVSGREIVQPLRKAIRVATPADDAHDADNRKKAEEAFVIGNKKIEEHKLDMKLIDTEFTFDNGKLLFYFTSDGRVDFRELVRDLASVFRCRIELRQMGIRDEAKILGGLGICGRPFCCHAFLPDFVQVSIKMAKEQNLALNAAKISGTCGRLMCCLRYEYDSYLEEGRLTPKVDSIVNTPDGIGVVTEAKPLTGMVKVKSLSDGAGAPRVYHRDQLSPVKKGDDDYEWALEEKNLEKQAKAAGTTRAALKAAMNLPPEKAAERQARAQSRLLQSNRPEPQKAAFYSGQVLPSALEAGSKSRLAVSKKEPAVENPDVTLPEDLVERENIRSTHPNRRGGKRNKNRRDFRAGDKKKTAAPGEQNAAPADQSAPPAPPAPTAPTAGEGNRRRYEKYSKNGKDNRRGPSAQPVPAPVNTAPASPHEQNAVPVDQSAAKKKNRPFRRYKKKGNPPTA